MAKVPSLPSPGQPIDTYYLYGIVESLIDINNSLASTGSAYIDNGEANSSTISQTGNVIISARTVSGLDISNSKSMAVGDTSSGTIDFKNNSAFSKPPVVTATLVSTGTTLGAVLNLTISSVTTSGFKWKTYCMVKGFSNYNISFTAIGS